MIKNLNNVSILISNNLDTILKILATFISFVISFLLTRFAAKRFNLNEFLFSLMYPKPIIGDFFIKLANQIVKDELIDGILQLKQEIISRFGSLGTIPVILDIYETIQIKSVGNTSRYFSNKEISWCVNNKMCIVFVNQLQIKKIVTMLHYMFQGSAIQGIVIHFKKPNFEITSICNLIFSIIKTVIPITLVNDLDNMFLQSFADIYSQNDAIGLDIRSDIEFQQSFDQFIHTCILKSLYYDKNLNINFPRDIEYLLSIKSILEDNINQVENSEMFVRGLYFICFDKISLKDQIIYTENLYSNIIYSLSNECKFIDSYKNERRYNIIKILSIITLSISCIMGLFVFKSINKKINIIQLTAKVSECVAKNQMIDETQILKNIQYANAKSLGFFTQLIATKEIKNLQYLRNFLISNSTRVFDTIDNIDTEEIFNYSPIQTKAFQKLDYNVRTVVDALNGISNFVNSDSNYHSIDEKIKTYTNLCKNKILKNFTDFFTYFQKYSLFYRITFLQNSIQNLLQKPTIEKIEIVLDEMRKTKALCKLSSNSWWINEDLGNMFSSLKNIIKSIPNIGDNLQTEIDFMAESAIKQIKDGILEFEIPYVGRLFIIDNRTLQFSEKANNFFYYLGFLSQEPLIQLPVSEMQYTVPEKSDISLWELDILDKILQKIAIRDDFIKGLASYPMEMKKIAVFLADNRLLNFIKSELCKAQKLIPNSISIEEKAKNIGASLNRLDKIQQFMTRSLNKNMPNFVDFLVSDSILKICEEFRFILNNSIFTVYTRLAKWKGEDLIPFLFQCRKEDLPFIISKTIEHLQDLNENVIKNIIGKLPEVSQSEYKFIKYIYNEINAYINGSKNHINIFENYINDLQNWKFQYNLNNDQISSKEEFFTFHEKTFRSMLIQKTNEIFLNKSKSYYNEVVAFFMRNLAGRFPFGGGEKANSLDIVKFIKLYKQYRDHLKSDAEFNRLPLLISLKHLDEICDFFAIENDVLFMNAKIQYHLPDGKNLYLVKNYFSRFGEEVIIGDFVEVKAKAINGFSLGIEIINSSKMKIIIKQEDLSSSLSTKIKFQFLEEYGFLKFCKTFLMMIKGTELTLKILIPLQSEDKQHTDTLICFIKILNYPYFFSEMRAI